ncbi:MAG: cell division protein FtsZ [Bacteroidetes bacterium]|nr:cell division protein FtsZ [Bacteroidota bacterium]
MKFDLPKNQSSIIKVIGVGGGGSNAVNYMFNQGIDGVDFIICNTDAQALEMSPVPIKIQLGSSLTEGRGAGAIPSVGREAAIEDLDRITALLEVNTEMLFITAGMGGGTGTGAAPVIAAKAKELGILTVGIVTVPFSFEGRKRKLQAQEGIEEMRKNVDTLLIVCNDKLRELYGNLALTEAFSKADNILSTAAKGIAEIITHIGQVNVDIEDVKTVMKNSGVAIMGSGTAEGEDRAIRSIEMALASPLLDDNNIKGASYVLLNITSGSEEISMDEVSEITDYIQDEAGSTAEIIFGVGKDETLGNKVNVTLVATGFDKNSGLNSVTGKEHETTRVILPLIVEDKKVEKIVSPVVENELTNIQLVDKKLEEVENATEPQTPTANRTVYTLTMGDEEPVQKIEDKIENSNEPVLKVKQESIYAIEESKVEDYKPVTFSGADKLNTEIHKEGLENKANDRISRLKELSLKLKTQSGVVDLENEPAYRRRNVVLSNITPSSESQVSRFTLSESDDNIVEMKSNNSFLHDNVD